MLAGIWESGAGKERRERSLVESGEKGRVLLVKGIEVEEGQKPGGRRVVC